MANLNKKIICPDCKGNGFIRVPYKEAFEEQWADCKTCNNQGEVNEPDEKDKIIEEQKGKIKFLQDVCRRAGAEIKELTKVIASIQRGADYENRASDFNDSKR